MTRDKVSKEELNKAIKQTLSMLDKRIQKKGNNAYSSRHEIFGIVYEEAVTELSDAMHSNDGDNFVEELVDVAVAAIYGIASHNTIYNKK